MVRSLVSCLLTLALWACGAGVSVSAPEAVSVPAEAIAPPAPTPDQVANATYTGITDEPVTLRDGSWEGPPVAPGAPMRPSVTLVRDFFLVGNVGGGPGKDAVVLLAFSSGGSGEELYLAAVETADGMARDLGTAHLGHNVKIREGRIEGRRIVLDVLEPGPDDAMCCPGQLATRTFELRPTGLVEASTKVTGRLSLATLEGTQWVLRRFAFDQEAPRRPEVTLEVQAGRFGGSAGCNHYDATLTERGQPGDIGVGPIRATQKMCPPDVMAVETRYLKALEHTVKFSFMTGELLLITADDDGSVGSLFFAPAR